VLVPSKEISARAARMLHQYKAAANRAVAGKSFYPSSEISGTSLSDNCQDSGAGRYLDAATRHSSAAETIALELEVSVNSVHNAKSRVSRAIKNAMDDLEEGNA
jgi:hypothetical protein